MPVVVVVDAVVVPVVPGCHGRAAGQAGDPGDPGAGWTVDHTAVTTVTIDQWCVVDRWTPDTWPWLLAGGEW